MLKEYKVYVTEKTVRPVWVVAETPAEAEQIAEENYSQSDVADVEFEADPAYRQSYLQEEY